MNLLEAQEGRAYVITSVNLDDEDLVSHLFSLGCYSGEPITVIKSRRSGCIVSIKEGRYSIDSALAAAISVK